MSHPHEQLLRDVYEAQSRGDLEAYLGFLAEDFVLHIPGRSRIAGDYRGKEDLRRHFREIAELTGGTFEPRFTMSSPPPITPWRSSRPRGNGRGGAPELPRVHVWHVRGGKLTELWLHPVDQYAFDDFWGER